MQCKVRSVKCAYIKISSSFVDCFHSTGPPSLQIELQLTPCLQPDGDPTRRADLEPDVAG
jgi:hypothetical protein